MLLDGTPIDAEQFWSKVDRSSGDDGCRPWLASRTRGGYGVVMLTTGDPPRRRAVCAHRIAYTLTRGAIPAGLVIDHLCQRRDCCNPAHMESVTQGENLSRGRHPNMVAHRERTCTRGHTVSGANAKPYTHKTRGLIFLCRECDNARQRAYHARKREQR